jgi:hypothetical protein
LRGAIQFQYAPRNFFDPTYSFNRIRSILSDYSYDRVIPFATARIRDRFGLNGFFSHEPERHKREGDDSTITLFSFSLSYAF